MAKALLLLDNVVYCGLLNFNNGNTLCIFAYTTPTFFTMTNQSFEFEYKIEAISKSQLANEQRVCTETIRRRFKELDIDTGRRNSLYITELKAYYDVWGKPTTIRNAG